MACSAPWRRPMPSALAITDIRQALSRRLFPSITTWNRLEARPRTPSFDRGLRARGRDPLWVPTKQWQGGEFRRGGGGAPGFPHLALAPTRPPTLDAGPLNLHLKPRAGTHAYEGGAGVSSGDTDEIDHRAQKFVAWYERVLLQPPADDDAFVPPHLEYQFAASAPLATGEKVY